MSRSVSNAEIIVLSLEKPAARFFFYCFFFYYYYYYNESQRPGI